LERATRFVRLRAAALILLIGFGVFLIHHVVGVLTGEPLSPVLLGFHVLVVLVLGFCAAPLCRHCTVSVTQLRISELIIFGLPAVFFLMVQHRVTLEDARRGVTPPAFDLLAAAHLHGRGTLAMLPTPGLRIERPLHPVQRKGRRAGPA
jgi:hypothetical protein